MTEAGPTRSSADLADVVELLLDKGLVVNADIAVSIGDTELLGIRVRAAVASFETAAQYGLEFPEGTDRERIEQVANRGRLADVGGGPPAGTTDVSIAGPSGNRPAEPTDTQADERGLADDESSGVTPAVRRVEDPVDDAATDLDGAEPDSDPEPSVEEGGGR